MTNSFPKFRRTRCARAGGWVLCVVAAVTVGCARAHVLVHDGKMHDGAFETDIRENVIAIDNDGRPRDPVNITKPSLSESAFDDSIARIFTAMDAYHAHHGGYKKKILIFVHGGLNTPEDSLNGADNEIARIEAGVDGYFPIFINWNSDLLDSYGEHLTSVTQGCKQYDRPALRGSLSPLYLFGDLGRALSRIPVVWAHQISTDLSAVRADYEALRYSKQGNNGWIHTLPQDNTRKTFLDLNRKWLADYKQTSATQPKKCKPEYNEIQISIGNDYITRGQLVGLSIGYALTSPFKFGLSWILDGFGKPAWDNMYRRTQMLFDGLSGGNLQYSALSAPDLSDARRHTPDSHEFLTKGALQVFVERLAVKIDADRGNPDYEVTLIGHSMGAIVLNEWVRRNDNIKYQNIVYMAAACTVRSFSTTVVPYLVKWPCTRFYNLTLHPECDLRERRRGYDLPPRGSLLVWIDDFLSDPSTPFDRTLGRWQSLTLFDTVVPQNIRGRVTFKAFDRNASDEENDPANASDPQTHGGFRTKRYWCPAFWTATRPREQNDALIVEAKQAPAADQASGMATGTK